MMKINFFSALAIFGFITHVAALPAPEASSFGNADPEAIREYLTSRSAEISKRTVGGIYICTEQYWKGTCGYKVQPLNTCIRLDPPWWHTISSFGPDKGTTCNWYSDYNCGNQIASGIKNPGIDDMDTPAPGCEKRGEDGLEKRCHGNNVGSFKCWAT